MLSANKVTLQINLAPGDYPHARHILIHQLKILSKQVNEIIVILETQPSKGRFSDNWNKNKGLLDDLLQKVAQLYPIKIIPVDYGASTVQKIASCFFRKPSIPAKDFRGGPFYAYFFGLYSAKNDIVFHLDSDIFLGGGSQTWIKEAITKFQNDPACFIVSPLPGPPHPEGKLIGQNIIDHISLHTYQLRGMSTRLFMINLSLFNKNKLQLTKPRLRNQLKAVIEGNSNADLPEQLITNFIVKHQLKRIDFLGDDPGLWSLHPPYRTKQFYADLPQLISYIQNNTLPVAQQGFYDIIDEVCDWTDARTAISKNRWWKTLINSI